MQEIQQSDNGTEVKGETKELMKKLGVKVIRNRKSGLLEKMKQSPS